MSHAEKILPPFYCRMAEKFRAACATNRRASASLCGASDDKYEYEYGEDEIDDTEDDAMDAVPEAPPPVRTASADNRRSCSSSIASTAQISKAPGFRRDSLGRPTTKTGAMVRTTARSLASIELALSPRIHVKQMPTKASHSGGKGEFLVFTPAQSEDVPDMIPVNSLDLTFRMPRTNCEIVRAVLAENGFAEVR